MYVLMVKVQKENLYRHLQDIFIRNVQVEISVLRCYVIGQ